MIYQNKDDLSASVDLQVVKNPVDRVDLSVNTSIARTGDVLPFNAVAKDKDGQVISDAPIAYSFTAFTDDQLGQASSGQIDTDGRFVAEKPGRYVVMALSGSTFAQQTVQISQRTQDLGRFFVKCTHFFADLKATARVAERSASSSSPGCKWPI